MTHKELVDIGYLWALKRCGVAFKEFKSLNDEIPDVIGFSAGKSILIEVKVSRADFLKDKKKPHRAKGMGMFRFFLCPDGLIKVYELPEKWGLIYVNDKGKCKMIFNPYNLKGGNMWSNGFMPDLESENRLMYSALRRLHLRNRISEIYTPLKLN